MEKLLTTGAITQILADQKPANPVLQIIGYKPMGADQTAFGQATEELRYRLMIGDGDKAHQYCIITNQDIVNDIKNSKIEKWSIIKVSNYQTVDSNGRKLIYILNLTVIKPGSEVGCKLTATPGSSAPPPAGMHANGNGDANRPMQQQTMNRPPLPTSNPYQPMETQAQPYQFDNSYNPNPATIKSPRRQMDQPFINIGELTPYIGKWVIKGRCVTKSGIREYNNAKGAGKLFSFTLADKTGELKVTGFNQDCERCFPMVEPNKVYILGRATAKAADKRYTTADVEVTLNSDSLLEEMDASEVSDVPLAKFNFVSLGSIASSLPATPVDLIGAITDVSEVSNIISKTKNKELTKRSINIVDMSRHSIEVTLWGEQAHSFNGAKGDIFVTKGARIGSYGGRSASAGDCCFINPNVPEVRKLKNWFDNLMDQNFTALTSSSGSQSGGDQWKLIDQFMNMEQAKIAQSSGNPNTYGKCKAILMTVGKNPVYKCCPTEGCGKKLVDTQNGELKCDKCQQTYSAFKYRFKTDVEIQDCSGSAWVTLWDEKAEAVLGMKPEDLERLMKMDNKDEYDRAITKPAFQPYVFTLRARLENYQNDERVKLHVVNLAPGDAATIGKHLMEDIKKMS